MTNHERAEKIIRFVKTAKEEYLYADDSCLDFVSHQLDEAVREAIQNAETIGSCADGVAYASGFSAAKEKAAGIAKTLREEKQKCSPNNTQHDDRWCPECEAMEDAYGVIEGRILAMEP